MSLCKAAVEVDLTKEVPQESDSQSAGGGDWGWRKEKCKEGLTVLHKTLSDHGEEDVTWRDMTWSNNYIFRITTTAQKKTRMHSLSLSIQVSVPKAATSDFGQWSTSSRFNGFTFNRLQTGRGLHWNWSTGLCNTICCASTSGSPSDPLTPATLALSSPGPGWILFITISRFGLKYMGTCSDMDTRMGGERCGPLAVAAAFNLWMHVLVQGRQLKLIFAK